MICVAADPNTALADLRSDLRAMIRHRRLTFRQAAQEIGSAYATVHRTCHGVRVPNATNFVRMRAWIAARWPTPRPGDRA